MSLGGATSTPSTSYNWQVLDYKRACALGESNVSGFIHPGVKVGAGCEGVNEIS